MFRARIVVGIVFSLVGVALAALVLLYFAQPTSYRFSRTRTIVAPRERVMSHLSELHAFEAWDPWASMPTDPPTVTYSPVSSGVGAWVDRRDSHGGARTTITSITADRVEMTNTTFGGLGGNTSTQSFELRDSAGGTEVTWSLGADLHGLARMLWPFVHLEESAGRDMDEALVRLDQASQ